MLLPRPEVREFSAAQRDKARRVLERTLGPSKVLTEPSACEPYTRDESEAEGRLPDAVVLPENADDVLAALAAAAESGVPITPRAGGTGRVGGAVPVAGGIVLSMARMRSIKDIDRREQIAVVEPGLVLSELHAAVEAEGLFYPPDPSSLVDCAIGGNVATNAGGPRAFKYGVTGNYVLGMEALLIGGQRLRVGRRTRKGVTGYDVTSLLVGSEGTLALLGDITLRLVPKPEAVMTLMALFETVAHAARAVEEIILRAVTPRCIELFDGTTLEAVRTAGNAIDRRAGAMLMVEVDGDASACEADAVKVGDACEAASAFDVLVAQEASQRDRLWAARREMSPAVRKLSRYKLSEDVVVPRTRSAELLERVRATGERLEVFSLAYGHAGDGNFHVNFLWNEPGELANVQCAIEQLFRDTVELGGTLTGEHGIGVLKAPYLPLEQSAELIALQRDLKRVFDPRGLLNPGKVLSPVGHGDC